MSNDFEIGRVIAVDTARVTIQLNDDMKGFTRTTYAGVLEVGRINSYVVIPVGTRRLIAVVTRVEIDDRGPQIRADHTMVALPAARRIMKATLIGMLDSGSFTQGISVYPVLDNPVFLAATGDIDRIFDRNDHTVSQSESSHSPAQSGFRIDIGESTIFEDCPLKINPDIFFGKHVAILGSTGSGKSCTIASIIQSILSDTDVRRTNFVILDTNGEYRSAFPQCQENGSGSDIDINDKRTLYIPSDQDHTDHLAIPYWFLNTDDFIRLFDASERVQAPVLMRALQLSRARESNEGAIVSTLNILRTSCSQILAIAQNSNPTQLWAIPKNIMQYCADILCYGTKFPESVHALECAGYKELFQKWKCAIKSICDIASEAKDEGTPRGWSPTRIQQICNIINPIIKQIDDAIKVNSHNTSHVNADQPSYFEQDRLLESMSEVAIHEQIDANHLSPMRFRINRFFEDPRFNFLFARYPDLSNVLAAFLRDLLGLHVDNSKSCLSDERPSLPFYNRYNRQCDVSHHVVIIDLSLLANEVVENVVALIGRLILEFLQRLGEYSGGEKRGSLPVVLVLEEAQNYIAQSQQSVDSSISRTVFERIAREGRKYGIGLVVASQRPSELSRTILSQCSSFVVHRLQNPEDLRYFREVVPGIYAPLLEQLPSLAPQMALVLGECVRAPALVRIRDAHPLPRSNNPCFYDYWVGEDDPNIDIEAICAQWEGKSDSDNEAINLCTLLHNSLSGCFKCSQASGARVHIQTPLTYPDSDRVDVFVIERNGQYIVTDYGEALGRFSRQVDDLHLPPDIKLYRGRLVLHCENPEDLGEVVQRFAQAIADI